MPYILASEREKIEVFLTDLISSLNDTDFSVGTMNYVITELCLAYLDKHGMNYQHINDVNGFLSCARDEFNRRITGKYEDQKARENGDLYTGEIDPRDRIKCKCCDHTVPDCGEFINYCSSECYNKDNK